MEETRIEPKISYSNTMFDKSNKEGLTPWATIALVVELVVVEEDEFAEDAINGALIPW